MALVVADRVQETTTTTGQGTVTLAGASAGYQSFAVIGNGNTTYYTLTSGNNWEVGVGTYTLSGTTLARTTVLASSAGGTTKITLSGTSNVFVTYPAEIATMLTNPTPTNGGVVYGTGTAIGVSAVGTVSSYQFLQSAGAASPTWVQINSFKDVATAPTSPTPIEGDRFFDNTTGIDYTYITDTDGSQWVETSAAGTPTNGVFSTMALGGATLGSNALAITGTTLHNSNVTFVSGAVDSSTGFTPSQTNGIVGTTTNNSANAGSVGEFVSASVAFASPTSLTTATQINLTSISLTAGDWDVSGNVTYNGAATTSVQYLIAGISSTSASVGSSGLLSRTDLSYGAGIALFSQNQVSPVVGPVRFSLSATTTIYLIAYAGFTTSTANASGQITARRRR